MTGTNFDLFTHKSSRSYLNHLVYSLIMSRINNIKYMYLKTVDKMMGTWRPQWKKRQLCNKQQVDLYIAVYNCLVQYMRYIYI
jgi:hypothetical protein